MRSYTIHSHFINFVDVLRRWQQREEAEKEAKKAKEVHVPGDFPDIRTAVQKSKPFNRIIIHRGLWMPPEGENWDLEIDKHLEIVGAGGTSEDGMPLTVLTRIDFHITTSVRIQS